MRGWYLLKSGATEDGEAVFRELLGERPDDADVRITLGHARSDAGLQDAALEAFDDALAAAKRRGLSKEIDRARVERRAEREHVGLALDADDRLAPAPRPPRSGPIAWALAWFPPDQHTAPWGAGPTWLTTSRIRCATHGASRSSYEGSTPPSGTGPRSRR